MIAKLKPYAKYVSALVAGLCAANGVLHLVPAPVVNEVLGLLGALGLYVIESPVGGGK